MPWEAVQRRMLERLHEGGYDDLDAAHLSVFGYPGPQGLRPSELAARLRISKQALNYLLGELERELGLSGRRKRRILAGAERKGERHRLRIASTRPGPAQAGRRIGKCRRRSGAPTLCRERVQ